MPPKKKIAALVKVQLQAGAATPAPPVGTALGPHGVNIMDFCKAYNAQTEAMRGNVIPVEITIYEDRSFTFITKTPPAAELIKKAAGVAAPACSCTLTSAAIFFLGGISVQDPLCCTSWSCRARGRYADPRSATWVLLRRAVRPAGSG